jgi:hypothetical protein
VEPHKLVTFVVVSKAVAVVVGEGPFAPRGEGIGWRAP